MTTLDDIQIPVDMRASRLRGAERPTPPPAVDDVAQTLAEYTRLALSTGSRLEIDPVEFTADGEVWVPLWLHTEPPVAARATVRRDDVETVVYRRWVEAIPGETALTDDGRRWCDIWEANPTERLESYVLRAALARAFADVIGDRPDPGKPRTRAVAPVAAEPAEGGARPAHLACCGGRARGGSRRAPVGGGRGGRYARPGAAPARRARAPSGRARDPRGCPVIALVGAVALMLAVVSVGMLVIAGVRGDRRPVATFSTSLVVSLILVAASIVGESS
ncbi:hypothetical protein [Microbacterium sp. SORGH_AS_0454]|uniref:hypothetical protein n=1 Tax=Microbacterium sp. SORGH_AS_0454 TaxID=3041758 RepID=UPI0028665DB7|nr:hypothetical protein [Microbacterium sp. SORGH_AS_0454]MDR6098264.1 hypothetical protein [Microbacterium sp. SORGH_AS_0454]